MNSPNPPAASTSRIREPNESSTMADAQLFAQFPIATVRVFVPRLIESLDECRPPPHNSKVFVPTRFSFRNLGVSLRVKSTLMNPQMSGLREQLGTSWVIRLQPSDRISLPDHARPTRKFSVV
jgi:hypothetical protein